MTIVGRYGNTSHAPYVDAHVLLPSLRLQGGISFLIDTGADTTVMAEVDANRLGIDYSKLPNATQCFGIGGVSRDYVEPAVLLLADGAVLHFYRIKLTIKSPDPALRTMPSLLGRDVINRLQVTLNHSASNCHIEIITSDGTI